MSQMKAWRVHRFGGPETVEFDDIAVPAPLPHEVLVRIQAASVNPVDIKTREGHYPPVEKDAIPYVLGRDFSGVVERVGSEVSDWQAGDEVIGLAGQKSGTFADYVCVDASTLARRPDTTDVTAAAAVPLAALTAWQGLFDHGGVKAGDRVLIHAATGGVGHFAVQLAKARGAYVIATASEDGLAFAKALGADEVIDYNAQRFEDQVRDVDVVYDLVGGDTQIRSWTVLKRGGALISTLVEPSKEEAAARGVHAMRYMVQPDGNELAQIARLIDEHKVEVTVSNSFPFERTPAAVARLERGHVQGKVVVTHP